MESALAIVAVCLGALYWRASQQSKQLAVSFARRECERRGAQLLDQTVQQIKLSMSRNRRGQWRFWREYRFEYSVDGNDRYEGRLVLLGRQVVRTLLEKPDPVIH